jgi:hypothetical protein
MKNKAGRETQCWRECYIPGMALIMRWPFFFPQNWFGLPAIATLLPVITPFSLVIQRILALLVLCHFVKLVLATLFAESSAGFRNSNHDYQKLKVNLISPVKNNPQENIKRSAMLYILSWFSIQTFCNFHISHFQPLYLCLAIQ